MKKDSALFIVDVQNDFLPGGALGVPRGDEVIGPINQLVTRFDMVLASKDWHPADTVHFEKWPKHCVRATRGAMFPPSLDVDRIDQLFLKGTGNSDDGYSAFEATNEDLAFYLRAKGVSTLFVVGLATDYCVMATAVDAVRHGFDTYVIPEAIRAVNLKPEDEANALENMRNAGVRLIGLEEVV